MTRFLMLIFLALTILSCNSITKTKSGNNNPKTLLISELPNEVNESSALLFFEGFIYTINDSGNEPILYQIDTTNFQITRRIYFNNIENNDWEALTANETHIFIGDFGDNYGNRNNLCIYYFKKNKLEKDTITPKKISFEYSNWEEPKKRVSGTDFDCETMLAFNDTIWLFTKQWNSLNTTIYKLPIIEGHYNLTPWITLPINGLATDACFGNEENDIWITGYKDYIALLWKTKHNKLTDCVEVENRWILDTSDSIQNEGIFFVKDELWITTEDSKDNNASVYKIFFQ